MVDRQLCQSKSAFSLYYDYRRTVLLETCSHTIPEPYFWTESDPIAKAEIVSVNPGSKREL